MTDYFALVLAGNLIQAIITVFTDLIGSWFWVLYFGTGMTMLYIGSKDFASTSLVGLLIASVVIPAIPGGSIKMVYMFMALGATIILYRVFH